MSIMNGKEMMAVCEEKGLLVPHDDIPIIGLEGTVVKDTTVRRAFASGAIRKQCDLESCV